jgi:hypothetical protein
MREEFLRPLVLAVQELLAPRRKLPVPPRLAAGVGRAAGGQAIPSRRSRASGPLAIGGASHAGIG